MRGLEPPRLATLAPQTSVSTITPHPHKSIYINVLLAIRRGHLVTFRDPVATSLQNQFARVDSLAIRWPVEPLAFLTSDKRVYTSLYSEPPHPKL